MKTLPDLPPKARIFVLGVCSGVALLANWRPVAKSTIKVGVRGASMVREAAARSMESLTDVAEEALWEMRQESSDQPDGDSRPHVNGSAFKAEEQVATRL